MLGAFKVVFLQDVCNANFASEIYFLEEQSDLEIEVSFNWTIWCGSLQKLFYDLGHAIT